jgi:hypothetical protein
MGEGAAIDRRVGGSIPHPLRIAVVSTPRSGNTWFRRLLATTYGLEEWAVHNPADLDRAGLSSRCLVQLDWQRVEPFTSMLQRQRFRVVVLSRHPLDVLISILHFAPHEPLTARWLEGEGGDEVPIYTMRCRAAGPSWSMPRGPGRRPCSVLATSGDRRRAATTSATGISSATPPAS